MMDQAVKFCNYLLTQEPNSLIWMTCFISGLSYIFYWTCQVIYRLTFHPLARFPGPFLCRIGYLQQCYYEAILNGQFFNKIQDYHRKYGPIVRINPNEVHIDDHMVFHEIYKQNSNFTKDPASYALGISQAMAFTIPVEVHKLKRQTLDPSFSKRRVSQMEDGLYEELERCFDKIDEYGRKGENVPIAELYFCYTADIISRYLFGKSLDLISAPDFIEKAEEMRSFTKGAWVSMHFPLIRSVVLSAPRWVVAFMSDAWVKVFWFCEDLAKQAIAQFDPEKADAKSPTEETIFDRLLLDNSRRIEKGKKARPLTFEELADESVATLNAGTEPTATMMTYATYFFLRYPEVQHRILKELGSVELDLHGRMPLQKLEGLPYFTGFVRETLRFMPLVPGRLPRSVPKGGLYVPAAKETIPEGSIIGISHLAVHQNPEIFAEPLKFLPERWIGEKGKELNHWLLSFSKGRTDCIGKNLAYAEMHLVLGNLFTRFDLELAPGSHEGMQWMDRVIVHPKQNLRIKVKPKQIKKAT